jgi:flagellar FliJ protein
MGVKKFVFKFERILKIKETEEKKETAILSKIRHEIGEIEKAIENKKKEIEDLKIELESKKIFTIDTLRYYSTKNDELEKQLENLKIKLDMKKKEEKEQEKKVIEISKYKKMLEKLKEKHRIAFYKDQEKKINNFMDELGTQRFNRKKIF